MILDLFAGPGGWSEGAALSGRGDEPDCGCPNRHCACVYRERIRGLEKEVSQLSRDRTYFMRFWQAAASLIAYNRDRVKNPRGVDERRLLTAIDIGGATIQGPFYAGTTDGNLDGPTAPTDRQTSLIEDMP